MKKEFLRLEFVRLGRWLLKTLGDLRTLGGRISWRQMGRQVSSLRSLVSREMFIRPTQASFLFLGDVVVVFFSLFIAAYLVESDFSSYSSGFLLKNMLIVTFVTLATFLFFGIYGEPTEKDVGRPLWARPSTAPLSLVAPLIVALALIPPLIRLSCIIEHFSRITPLVSVCLSFVGMTCLRSGFDAWNERKNRKRLKEVTASSNHVEALLVGTFADLEDFLGGPQKQDYRGFRFLAAVTTNALDCGRYLGDIAVLGALEDLEHLLSPQGELIQPFPYVFVVGKSLSGRSLQKVSRAAHKAHVPVLTLLRSRSTVKRSLDEISQK